MVLEFSDVLCDGVSKAAMLSLAPEVADAAVGSEGRLAEGLEPVRCHVHELGVFFIFLEAGQAVGNEAGLEEGLFVYYLMMKTLLNS